MPSAVHSALARGLDVLASSAGNGEAFTAGSVSFTGSITSQIIPDGIGGRIVETIICADRSAFSALPAEGAVIARTSPAESFRVAECRPGAGGFIDIIVRHAQT